MTDWDDAEDIDESLGVGELEAVPIEFPDNVGECIDKLFALRSQRILLGREVDARKRTEAAYAKHIVEVLQSAKLTGGNGEKANASYKEVDEPTPKDWPQIWAYIVEHNAFDLLAKKLSGKAVRERWDQAEQIPGIGTFTKLKLSLTKR